MLGQVELVVGAQAVDAVFEHQGRRIAHIRPERLHPAVGNLQFAFGGDRDEAEVACPVDLPAVGTGGHQRHVGTVFGQGAEVLQFEVEFVVEKLDRFAGPGIFEMHHAISQFDPFNPQRKRLCIRIRRDRFAGRNFEETEQIEFAFLVEQDFALGFVQLNVGQVQRLGPQAVDLQVGVEPFETDLLLARFANDQSPQR